ncbi:MAG: sigma 54-interacting transcriptional regulator [Myxococcales bacterium]|nr:sigma 54-interacting transcriptional regulator [Myxococcales bacterium]
MSRASGSAPPDELPTAEHRGDASGRRVRRRGLLRWSDASGVQERVVEGPLVVGSAAGAGLVLADRTVSRLHAALELRDDGLWVRDLGSRNGSYVDELRVECARLPHHGKLRLGSSVLTAHYEAEPQPVELWDGERFGPLLGGTPVMRELFARLGRIAATESSVLVHGETGTGKELVARALHEASPRAAGPFVVVDCAALSESLSEAELFGHARGAFTGAVGERPGAIEAADGGSVFFDEIGELPSSLQPKLLRVLEAREVRRVGESSHRKVDVRFLSATHRDLPAMVSAGAFREDLYFRLAVLVVTVPPLRERSADIPLLAAALAPGARFEQDELAALARRPWLGNVRELRNFLERAAALGHEEALAMAAPAPSVAARPEDGAGAPSLDGAYKEVREAWLEHLERAYFRRLLERHGRDVAAAARAAGVDRTYVYRLIRRHDL